MHKFLRYIYLNFYAFLLLFCGMLTGIIPVFKISKFLIIPQTIIILIFLYQSLRLFSTWRDKQIKYTILIKKNQKQFKPESFKIFMQAPCGRLLTKVVLKDLGLRSEYKKLLIYKESFLVSVKKNYQKTETKIYFNEDFK